MRSEAVKQNAQWAFCRPTVRARKREDVDFRAAEILNPCSPATTLYGTPWSSSNLLPFCFFFDHVGSPYAGGAGFPA